MAKSTRRSTKPAARPRRASTAAPDSTPRPTDLEIARRAFELFCERGGQAGSDVEDWLKAERELHEAVRPAARQTESDAGAST